MKFALYVKKSPHPCNALRANNNFLLLSISSISINVFYIAGFLRNALVHSFAEALSCCRRQGIHKIKWILCRLDFAHLANEC